MPSLQCGERRGRVCGCAELSSRSPTPAVAATAGEEGEEDELPYEHIEPELWADLDEDLAACFG